MPENNLSVEILNLIGKPFVDGGRGPDAYDCWGLCVEVYRCFGIELPDYKICCHDSEAFDKLYARDIQTRRRHDWPDVPTPAVLTIRFNSPKFVNHVGVYIGGGRFLHTREKTGVVIERVDSMYWKHRIEGFYSQK